MTTYTVAAIDISYLSTDAGGFNSFGGGQFTPGKTVTIAPGAPIHDILVEDDDPNFDDDDGNQTFTPGQVLRGISMPNGIRIESEYVVTLQDAGGTTYRMMAITAQGDAFHTYGVAFSPAMPPFGQPLTVITAQDVQSDPYASLAPACFTPGTRIATPAGPRLVETLRPGSVVTTLDAGPQPVRLVLRQRLQLPAGPHPHRPVHFPAGALGAALPLATLVLSPQHRLLVRDDRGGDWLVPAKALAPPETGAALQVQYLHLVLAQHRLIQAEGVWVESFWPGTQALASLTPRQRAAVAAVLPQPQPARPFLSPGGARRHPGPLTVPGLAHA